MPRLFFGMFSCGLVYLGLYCLVCRYAIWGYFEVVKACYTADIAADDRDKRLLPGLCLVWRSERMKMCQKIECCLQGRIFRGLSLECWWGADPGFFILMWNGGKLWVILCLASDRMRAPPFLWKTNWGIVHISAVVSWCLDRYRGLFKSHILKWHPNKKTRHNTESFSYSCQYLWKIPCMMFDRQ